MESGSLGRKLDKVARHGTRCVYETRWDGTGRRDETGGGVVSRTVSASGSRWQTRGVRDSEVEGATGRKSDFLVRAIRISRVESVSRLFRRD